MVFPIIQIVTVHWSKKSRGNPNATIRNSIPESTELPTDFLAVPKGAYYIHQQNYYEFQNFQSDSKCWSQKKDSAFKFDCIEIYKKDDNSFTINYCHKPDIAGRPVRPKSSHDVEAMSLSIGQFGRIRHNGRFNDFDTGDWYYEKVVFNIAITKERKNFDLFIKNKPDKQFDDMADLF